MDIENAIKTMDLFIYCGHGSGNEYFDYHNLVEKNIHCRATMFLMGCCSGELIDDGEIDPKGVPYYCNIAGSGSVLANLWNVTDKDIDRFLKQLLENMRQSEFCSLEEAVMAARSACKLRYLTGAAPVIYGFPTVIHVPEEVCQ
ncbi:Separin [Histomonas meleagridis]|uniref:Separin n=1 Tax=Histomonas meleagridis TaxID=135588 RepID=UPI003559677E|nr:Separin [Histomonas meleagridis]KAH0798896.1 Separin [Histomonas meleagridis]